jgi:hypothetical protein
VQKEFDLVFKGGTPRELIRAIHEQAQLKVNVIIPNEDADAQLPAIEVEGVTVPRLFLALTEASRRQTNVITGVVRNVPVHRSFQFSQGFRTSDNPPGQDSIWYFYVERPVITPDVTVNERPAVEVFQLAQLLKDHSIDEITTAVKTTWQMLDEPITPELKFHSDTGLLIAKGTSLQLQMVNQVLEQLYRAVESVGSVPLPALPPTRIRTPNQTPAPSQP